MPLGGTGPHGHGAIALVIDPVITAAIVEHRADHLIVEALFAQAVRQFGLSTLPARQAAHGKGTGCGKHLFE
ncbi:hypothetical protein D3C80_2083640 [compost metagenome]